MQQRKYDPKPCSNQHEAPSTARDTSDGKVLIWFKGPSEDPPEEYDYSVTHRTRSNWRVYFLLVCFVAMPICAAVVLVRSLILGV